MIDREKVIKGLEELEGFLFKEYTNIKAEESKIYYDRFKSLSNALDLLKKQKPRVMTLEEVKRHNNQDGCVWFEQPTYNAVAAFARKDDEDYTEIISPYLLGDPINHCYMANKFYGNAWRCWTFRPTDEQRQAVKWNDKGRSVSLY